MTKPHRWDGWPGAVCMNCGEEDPIEVCMVDCSKSTWIDCECADLDHCTICCGTGLVRFSPCPEHLALAEKGCEASDES